MGSLPNRCALHPHRRVVGICALCLHDRLALLIESVSPNAAASDGDRDAACVQSLKPVSSAVEHPRLPLPPPHTQLLSRERSVSGFNANAKASVDTVLPHHSEKLEDSINSALQRVKQSHQQLSFVQSPYQGAMKLDPAASPLPNEHASLPASRRRSNASVTDTRSFPGAMDTSSRRKGSWFFMSRGKSPLPSSPLPQIGRKHNDQNGFHSSPQIAVLAGRKSASDAIGRSCSSYRQAYMAELGSISEINLGDAAIKVERNDCNGDARANSSWISSLFHRRKGTRCKVDEQQDGGLNRAAVAGIAASQAPVDRSANRSPLPTFEPGRLSWDGPRPSVKQMLKRIEARKKQQRVDCSPLHSFATSNGRGACFEDAMPGQEPAFYKCKSAATSRRSTSVDVPKSSSKQAHLSSILHSDANANLQMESCNGQSLAREPRSWGRAWNRTFSPLLGFRTYAGKSPLDSGHQHQVYANLNHVNQRNALAGAPPSANRYLSPLSRSQCGPDSQIRIAS